jgi:hypothetical protein
MRGQSVSFLILSSHINRSLPSGLFPSGLPNKILHEFIISHIRATCLRHLTLLDLKKWHITTHVSIRDSISALQTQPVPFGN